MNCARFIHVLRRIVSFSFQKSHSFRIEHVRMATLNILTVISFFGLLICTNATEKVTKVADMRGQGLGTSVVYQKWQPPAFNNDGVFTVPPSSSVLVKVPGLTLILQHAHPMLYELNFEGVCRI